MDNTLKTLCDALKKVIWQLKPHQQPLSFLILVGKAKQGKSILLRQSKLEHVNVDSEKAIDIYYNNQGVILEMGDLLASQNKNLLAYTLKQLNRCHRHLKISGIILSVDINELLVDNPEQLADNIKEHSLLLARFASSLNYSIEAAIIFSKMDSLAGFCDFFQNEHASELQKPLGFSIGWATKEGKIVNNFGRQYANFIEMLGQQVIHKMHPARSGIKRTLIRELPLQFATLGKAIQSLLQQIPTRLLRAQAIYFTSGEQGGVSFDHLNKRISNEYALVVQDQFPQSTNHRCYFIEGAISAVQANCKKLKIHKPVPYKWGLATLASTAGIGLLWLGTQHINSIRSLDAASKELLTYDTLSAQKMSDETALYHLTQATHSLDKISQHTLFLPTIQTLKTELSQRTKQNLQSNFLPTILSEIEQAMLDSKLSQADRYQALKIYLMLGDPRQYVQRKVFDWFTEYWKKTPGASNQDQKFALLKETLRQPLQPIGINKQIVSDVRNYLNALPVNYLYFTLAKSTFPKETITINIVGFDLAEKAIPIYYTKSGFFKVITEIAAISKQLQAENWVLERQDLNDLPMILQQAYCYEYTTWWHNFIKHSSPAHFQDYFQARQLMQTLQQQDAIAKLTTLIQQNTAPDPADKMPMFNQKIASEFTGINLLSQFALHDLTQAIHELEKLLTTLSVVNDQGKTAFALAKARFEGDNLANPLSSVYNHVRQLPEPISLWVKQLGDDTWFSIISDCRNYINNQWQQLVIRDYQSTIARRFPFDATQAQDVSITDFDRFFSTHGILNSFVEYYLKPFLDSSQAQWQPKELNNYVLPISGEMINQLMRANVITNMFFPYTSTNSQIEFSMQKLNLDPVVANIELIIGNIKLKDTPISDNEIITHFHWPQSNARLTLKTIDGNLYEIDELGPWAFFKILQKVNVLVDDQDSSMLQILFEVNGNSGRYLLKAQNQVNPFAPGILNGFALNEAIT